MKHTVDFRFFPGYTRKSVTFTMDDGNVTWDKVLLDIVRPCGLRGTFNLCSHILKAFDAAGYRDFYRDQEIANHVRFHPMAMTPARADFSFSDAPLDPANAVERTFYKTEIEGYYTFTERGRVYGVATVPTYLSFTEQSRAALEDIFGEGRVTGFVWPYSEQDNEELREVLRNSGVSYMRKTGCVFDSLQYHFPPDRMAWSYTTDSYHLLACAKDYIAAADDGELRFFCFGVHAVDFERAGNWEDLREVCRLIGNRPEEYYYAPVIELFRYEDAVRSLVVTDEEVINPSDVTLYGVVDGRRVELLPHSAYRFA